MPRKHNDEAFDEWGNHAGETRLSIGNVNGNGNGTAGTILKALATVGALLVTAAISFAYGRIWDHEHRLTTLEAIETIRERAPSNVRP